MGIRVLFIGGSYINDSGLTKADYIGDLVERVTDDLRIKGGKSVAYLSGKGAGWLEDNIENTAETEKKEKDKILDRGIKLQFDSFELDSVSPEDKIDPNMPAFEFLAKYGKGGVRGLDHRRSMGLARKNLSTLVDFLSQSNEKSEEAEWIVLPVSNDKAVVEKCASIYRSSQKAGSKILLVENWPRADVSSRDKDVEAEETLLLRQALEASGVRQNDITVLQDPSRIKETISGPSRIMLVQSPLKLRRSAAILKSMLKDVKYGALPAYVLNIENICENESTFKNVAEECVKELRWIQDRLPVDNNRRHIHFLPDAVHDAYDAIFRLTNKTTEELFKEMREYSSREKMLANNGFSNVGMFPNGKGSYRIDNRGMSGIWKVIVETERWPGNRYMLRVADAVSKAMNEGVKNDETVCLRFVNDLGLVKGDVVINDDRSAAILFSEHAIAVTPDFIIKTRNEQEAVFRALIGGRAKDLPEQVSTQTVVSEKKDRARPDILVTQIAMVTELRSKDYQHYKCSQKTEGIAISLREKGYDSTYLPIEEDISYGNFLEHYAKHKQDIVVISIYQIHRKDLEILHNVCGEIKRINPNAFIVIEGASTDMAKQFLAICPEVDMFVRVESDEVIPKLAAMKEKGQPLTSEQIMAISGNVNGGLFIRSGSSAVISKLDTSNITHNIRLL
jgi:B12 binding domain.